MTPDQADKVATHLEHLATKVRERPSADVVMDLNRGLTRDAFEGVQLDGSETVTVTIRWPPTAPGPPRWAGSEPQEADPDLDDLTRDQLAELAGPAYPVAKVLDEWLSREHGILSSSHAVGHFLDLLAAKGYQVTPIDPGPPFEQLLPPPKD
jgi:hypothetical protein